MRSICLLCLLALMSPIPVSAKLSSIPVDQLIEQASVIVIARVTNLAEERVPAHPSRSGDVVFADAVAAKTLKGELPKNFRFLAQTDFICSQPGAVKDELALFFLYRGENGVLSILAFGHSRMAISELGGKAYVTASSVILWPKDAPARAATDQPYAAKLVELTYVEALIGRPIK